MRVISRVLAVLVMATFSHLANCDDTVKRSAELQVLDRFVGTWDMIVTAKPRDGQEVTDQTFETRSWSAGDKCLLFENPQSEKPDAPHFHMLVTYDPATKTYPGVMMIGASRSLVTGTWDQTNNTMTFNGKSLEDEGTFVIKNRFIDKDHSESTGILKNAKGEIVLELTQKQTRRGN